MSEHISIPSEGTGPDPEAGNLGDETYRRPLVLQVFEQLALDRELPAGLRDEALRLDPVVDRLLEGYVLVQGATAAAKRDRHVIALHLQGKGEAEIVEELGHTLTSTRYGHGKPLGNPLRHIRSVTHRFPIALRGRSALYAPESVRFMLDEYTRTADPNAILLPERVIGAYEGLQFDMPGLTLEEAGTMGRWLESAFWSDTKAGALTEKQVKNLGGYMLGILQGEEDPLYRSLLLRFEDMLERARAYTYEGNQAHYRSEEFRRALVFKPEETIVLEALVAQAKKAEGSPFEALLKYTSQPASIREREVHAQRRRVIAGVRLVAALNSTRPRKEQE